VGKDSYHLCDIINVYEDLRADAPTEGFSDDVLRGRLEVLELVKDEAVYQGGRVALADKGGTAVPLQLLPSALVLLVQVGLGVSGAGGGCEGGCGGGEWGAGWGMGCSGSVRQRGRRTDDA
jgi:hypothetical protein